MLQTSILHDKHDKALWDLQNVFAAKRRLETLVYVSAHIISKASCSPA